MSTGENFPSNSGETNPAENSGDNGWSNFPPFNGGEKPVEDVTEISEKNKSESEEYFDIDGVEYRDISKIDITSNQGKFEWIDSLVENCKTRVDDEYDSIIREEGLYGMDKKEQEEWLKYNDTYQDNRREYDLAKRQSKILENLDIDGEGGVLGALERKRNAFAEAMNNPRASSETQEAAFKNWDAAANLYLILAGEMARRDPEYFGDDEMKTMLNSEIKDAEKRVDKTMIDGYFGEDGFLHKAPNGEKMPGPATEDAEIELKYARQDAETFDLLMNDYQAANDYNVSRAIRKEDFAPTIDRFIEDHTNRINQLMTESKTLAKDTPEYAENEAKRRQLAKERSSARRLNARYFNIPRAETTVNATTPETPTTEIDSDNGEMSMEQMLVGNTEEQIETMANEHEQEKSPASYHIEGGLVDKDVTIMVGQEIPNEWFESKTYENGTSSGFGLNITRPPQIEDYLSQALNAEFGKLSEDERRHYDYSTLSKTIMAEAKRTKRIPDITNIMSIQRAISEQHGKVEQSYGQKVNQWNEEEQEEGMSM